MIAVQCMRARGYDMPVSLAASSANVGGYADVSAIFQSEEEAVVTGYPFATVDYGQGIDEFDAYAKTLSETERDRFNKDLGGDGGDLQDNPSACFLQAYEAVYGSFEQYAQLAGTFNEYSAKKTKSTLEDKDVGKAISERYMPCMASAGYEVNGLRAEDIAATEFGVYRTWNDPPGEGERALAAQDFECQRQAGLTDALDAALERTAGRWMVENEAVLLERHERLQEAMERAKGVISGNDTYETLRAEATP